jgi:ABC-type bacteriocin/lantibiotic exporter with double-glycine peptidase domain
MDTLFIIKYIFKKLKIPYTYTYLKNTVESNPNKDNLLGLSNMLSQYGIENQAISINSILDITNEVLPAICLFQNDLVILEKITCTNVEIVSKNGNGKIKLSDFEDNGHRVPKGFTILDFIYSV